MKSVATLAGAHNQIVIGVADEDSPHDVPFLCGSEQGFAPLTMASPECPPTLKRLATALSRAPGGPYVALVDAPASPRRLAIMPEDGRERGSGNFYQRHRPDQRLWRDFYYACTYTLVDELDRAWSTADLVLAHPTVGGWAPDLLPTVLEAIGHLADEPRTMALKRIHLFCLHDMTAHHVARAMRILNREQTSIRPPAHRTTAAAGVSPIEHLGLRDDAGIRLIKLELPAAEGSR